MVDIFDVIVQTGGVPFSPRVKSDDGKTYLDCPKEVTNLVYTKANDWYGDPLPQNIESRLGTELYGDIVLTSVRYFLDKEGKNTDENAFKELHNVILNGKEAVLDIVRKYLKDTDFRALKYADGCYTEEEYKPYKDARASARNEINEIEETFSEPTLTREEIDTIERLAMEKLKESEVGNANS
jgi:hypothetical protein